MPSSADPFEFDGFTTVTNLLALMLRLMLLRVCMMALFRLQRWATLWSLTTGGRWLELGTDWPWGFGPLLCCFCVLGMLGFCLRCCGLL